MVKRLFSDFSTQKNSKKSKKLKKTFQDFGKESEKNKEKVECFVPELNGNTFPHQIAYSSGKKGIFKCNKCPHHFSKQISKITRDSWCVYCSNQDLCGDKDCTYCFKKSYEYHAGELAQYWSHLNDEKPHEVFKGSITKYYHKCVKCDHHFHMSPDKILRRRQWCNFCANKVRCPEERDCHDCFRRSFASYNPDRVACWSSRNKKSPYQFALAEHSYAYFDCNICTTSFEKRLDKVSIYGQWCPTCHIYGSSKNAESIAKKINKLQGVTFTMENVVICNGRKLRWDFVVSNGNNIFHIETDGIQHFDLVKNMKIRREKNMENGKKLFSDQRTKDLLKDEHIRKNGGLLFRVSYKQLKIIDELVDKMINQSNNDVTGVVYMDEELYKNWGPIVYPNENEL